MLILGALVVCLCVYNIDRLMIESIVIIIGGLSGYKLKDSIDKDKIKTLEKTITDLLRDKT